LSPKWLYKYHYSSSYGKLVTSPSALEVSCVIRDFI